MVERAEPLAMIAWRPLVNHEPLLYHCKTETYWMMDLFFLNDLHYVSQGFLLPPLLPHVWEKWRWFHVWMRRGGDVHFYFWVSCLLLFFLLLFHLIPTLIQCHRVGSRNWLQERPVPTSSTFRLLPRASPMWSLAWRLSSSLPSLDCPTIYYLKQVLTSDTLNVKTLMHCR